MRWILFLMSIQLGDIFYRSLARRLKKYIQAQLNPRNVGSKRGLYTFVGLKGYLENLLDCNVDLVTKNALHSALKS